MIVVFCAYYPPESVNYLLYYEHNFVIANGFTARPYELRVYLFE